MEGRMMTSAHPGIHDPAFKTNPYPTYAWLREYDPVHFTEMWGGYRAWIITRYDDVQTVLKDPRFVKDPVNALPPEALAQAQPTSEFDRLFNRNLLSLDPPDHTRLRGLVHKAFTPRLIEGLRGRVQSVADELLDAVQAAGQMDLIADYAFPLPIIVISELLGAPAEDRDRVRHWSNIVVGDHSPEEWGQFIPELEAFIAYLSALFEARRASPTNDLMSALLEAEEAGDKLSEEELYAMVILLLIAGHETTVNLIGNGMVALLEHPDQLQRLKDNPTLIKPAIEELLRYDGPVETSTNRFVSTDLTFGGKQMQRGDLVVVVLAGADRDPAQFHQPDVLEIGRADNHHVAFGAGIHYCLGAPLARMEGQIAIATLLRRMPNLKLRVPAVQLEVRPNFLLRGYQVIPVTF